MPKYLVEITRTSFSSTSIKVDAESPDAAAIKAEEMAGSIEFGSGNAEYEVDWVGEVGE
jgi:hypothetical protein